MKARSPAFTAYLAHLHRIPTPLLSEEPSVDDKEVDICSYDRLHLLAEAEPRAAFILDKPPVTPFLAPSTVEIRGRRPRRPGFLAFPPSRAAALSKENTGHVTPTTWPIFPAFRDRQCEAE